MLSRSALPKLSFFSRQISKSVASANKFLTKDVKKVENDQPQETLAAYLKNESKHILKSSNSNISFRPLTNSNNAPRDNSYKREAISNHVSTKNYFNSLDNEDKTQTKSKTENHSKSHDEKSDSKEMFENLKKNIETNLEKNKNLIQITQELIEHYDIDNKIDEDFSKDSVKTLLTNKLLERVSDAKLDRNEFLTIANYIVRFEPKKFSRLNNVIALINSSLSTDQLVDLVYLLRSPRLFNENIKTSLIESSRLLKQNINEINQFNCIIKAMKIFAQDQLITKQLDYKLMQLKDKLTVKNWIDLLNTKSILRQRNITLIESCSYSLINMKAVLDIDALQKVLLSCGILSYHDEHFYKYLIDNLESILENSKSNLNWLKENEANMLSIISSIGMLQLRDKKVLDTICKLLVNNKSASAKLVISYVISCGFISYQPSDKDSFDALFKRINLKNFVLTTSKDKLGLLNYVWSLCIFDKATNEMLASVLDENFWSEFLDDKNKYLKSIILKLMQINLYAQLFHETYSGPLLPSKLNAVNYTNILKPEHDILTDQLVSTLSSFRTIDKYFKTSLLTPFGIYIDALLVIDEKGIIFPVADYFNENSQLQTKNPKEKKIAIKIADYKDKTRINNKINGNLLLQLILLKELGYTPLIITQTELSETSVIKRIDLIKKKLEKASQKTDEIFIE